MDSLQRSHYPHKPFRNSNDEHEPMGRKKTPWSPLIRPYITIQLLIACQVLVSIIRCPVVVALHGVQLDAPHVVPLGQGFWLSCIIPLNATGITNIAFNKDGKEFYRFDPFSLKHVITKRPGVFVSELSAGPNVRMQMSNDFSDGTYECVINLRGESEPVRVRRWLSTIWVPNQRKKSSAPRLELVDARLQPRARPRLKDKWGRRRLNVREEENLLLRCSFRASRPAALIRWFVNGYELFMSHKPSNHRLPGGQFIEAKARDERSLESIVHLTPPNYTSYLNGTTTVQQSFSLRITPVPQGMRRKLNITCETCVWAMPEGGRGVSHMLLYEGSDSFLVDLVPDPHETNSIHLVRSNFVWAGVARSIGLKINGSALGLAVSRLAAALVAVSAINALLLVVCQ